MEEAIIDVALDLNPPPSECSIQSGVQEAMLTDNRDSVQSPAGAHHGQDHQWSQERLDRVEALRLSIASGTYQVDTTELALCILRNATHFLETR